LGGTQTQSFVLYPAEFATPPDPIIGASALHDLLKSWRTAPKDGSDKPPTEVAAVG
jgi:hypothetical protein